MGKTLIVDDEEDMRVLLRVLINAEDQGLRVVGEAACGEDAIELAPAVDPDVVVMDLRMPGLDGLATAQQLLAGKPSLPIVLYSAFASDAVREQADRIGARRCGEKGDIHSLVQALRDLTAS